MSKWESIFFWITLGIYVFAAGGYLYSVVFKNPGVLSKITALIVGGLSFHSFTIAARYVEVGHLPWAGDYESSLMGGWIIIAGTLLMGWRNRMLQVLAVGTVPFVVIMMGFGFMRAPFMAPMVENLKSYWLYIHVYFAWLAFGSYVLGMAAGVLYLLKRRDADSAGKNPVFDQFPSLERLDELIFRYVVFGFINDTIMIAAGSIWAKDSWGSYWSWDPVEGWSLISWIIYGFTIHMRVIFGWREKRLAWLVIAALATVLIAFFGVSQTMTSHNFNVH